MHPVGPAGPERLCAALRHLVTPLCLLRSRNELLGDLTIDLTEVQTAPGGDVTKTWHLQNVPTDWMSTMREAMGRAGVSVVGAGDGCLVGVCAGVVVPP